MDARVSCWGVGAGPPARSDDRRLRLATARVERETEPRVVGPVALDGRVIGAPDITEAGTREAAKSACHRPAHVGCGRDAELSVRRRRAREASTGPPVSRSRGTWSAHWTSSVAYWTASLEVTWHLERTLDFQCRVLDRQSRGHVARGAHTGLPVARTGLRVSRTGPPVSRPRGMGSAHVSDRVRSRSRPANVHPAKNAGEIMRRGRDSNPRSGFSPTPA